MHIALTDDYNKSLATGLAQKFACSFLTGFVAAIALGSLVSVPDYGILAEASRELSQYFFALFF